jgi:hypothetical protein
MKKNRTIGIGLALVIFLFLLSLYWVPLLTRPAGSRVMESSVSVQPMPLSQPNISPNVPMTNIPSEIQVIVAQDYTDTLKNVYAPPVRYRETEFRQLGYLTAPNRNRLPLFGRVLNRRDKWAYYTLEQGIKLPIEVNRRVCTQSPGCDSLSSGDQVQVEGMSYKVNLYDSFLPSYGAY